ncbi:C2H2-type domain-containing protein [[Candida] zeylanoides]
MKAEPGSAKYQSKQLKLSGLQKLRFYCQLCRKQCRDANGFKNHLGSPSHKGRLADTAAGGGADDAVARFSKQFSSDFLRLLRASHGTKAINANKFYQEYILSDRDHVHMNATRWSSLTQYVKYLGQNGLVRVENDSPDDELSLSIAYIDRSPSAVQRQQLRQKSAKGDEEVASRLLAQQMERARQHEASAAPPPPSPPPPPTPPQGPIRVTLGKKGPRAKRSTPSAFEE